MAMDDKKVDRRRERSRLTRRRVIDAAARLFVERGYVASTIDDVAERAGVAVQTVYYAFGNKRSLLDAVLDASIAGDVEPVRVLGRAWVDALRQEQDAASAVRRLVEESVAILVRTAPVYEVVRRAAADPEVSALLEQTRARRRSDQRELIEILRSSGHLRAGLDVDTAADVFYGVVSEELLELLVGDCGWDVLRFQQWATTAMLQQLTSANPPGP